MSLLYCFPMKPQSNERDIESTIAYAVDDLALKTNYESLIILLVCKKKLFSLNIIF